MGALFRQRSRSPRRNIEGQRADISAFVRSNAEVQQDILGDTGLRRSQKGNDSEHQDDNDGESDSESFYTESEQEAEEVPASPEGVPSGTPTAELEAHHG